MRLGNDLFARAVNWLIDNKKVRDQQHLAEVTDITGTTISRIMNDRVKQPSKETIKKLLDAFPGIFNPDYFRGQSIWMTMQELFEARQDEKAKSASPALTEPVANTPDVSSAINASIAAYVQLTNRLTDDLKAKEREMADRLADKNARIATLESALADKQKLIEARDARILQLERQIAVMQSSDPSRYPFTVGAAEHSDYPEQRIQK